MFRQSFTPFKRPVGHSSALVFAVLVGLILLCFTGLSKAQNKQQDTIPDALKGWQNWVLKDKDFVKCPFVNQLPYANNSSHVCAWSGPLTLNLSSTKGEFEQSWQVLENSTIVLPGDLEHWPLNVTVNNTPIAVSDSVGIPNVSLKAGNYLIKGTFSWQVAPKRLTLSTQTPWLVLNNKGQKVEFPRVEGTTLLLNSSAQTSAQQDSLDIEVARKVTDGQHVQLDTHITLSVSGSTREVILGKVLPENFDLIDIQSELPSFIDANGLLRVQVKAGEHIVNVAAYAMPDTLVWQRPEISHVWPENEVWVIQTAPTIRSGKIEGAGFIDAEQANMPNQWYALPSYLLNANDALQYQVSLRGKPLSAQNRLRLKRDYWLSFDHQNLQFVDQINGNMVRDWRLSMQAPFELESADNNDGPILITQQVSTQSEGETGIENRYPNIDIEARGRVNKSDMHLITGWQHEFESVEMTINLPPGTLFLHASDVDRAASTWINKWGIWTSFVVLFMTIIAYRLMGALIGVLTAVSLILIYQETAAPIILMFNLIIAMTAKKHVNLDKLQKWVARYWAISIGLAFVAILYFCALQIKSVVYPQLETRLNNQQMMGMYSTASNDMPIQVTKPEMKSRIQEVQHSVMAENLRDEVELISVSGARIASRDAFSQKYQSDAVLQTGAGIPDWRWKAYDLYWNTPVSAAQTFDLMILSKNQYRLIKLAGVFILLAWFYLLCKPNIGATIEKMKANNKEKRPDGPNAGASALIIILCAVLFTPNDTHAQQQNTPSYVPPSESLNELREWLLTPPECLPQCAQLQSVQISGLNRQQSIITLEVHVNEAMAFALPRSEFLQIQNITLNNQAYTRFLRKQVSYSAPSNEWVFVWLPAGINKIDITSRIAPVPSWQLAFRIPPKSLNIAPSSDWTVNGIANGKMQGNEIEFVSSQTTPLFQAASTNNEDDSRLARVQPFPSTPLVAVTRRIIFDQTWRITTTVKRIAPSSGSINLHIPFIPGEFVLSNKVDVNDKGVMLTLPSASEQVSYSSGLARTNTLKLTAKPNNNTVEQWQILASPSNHIALSGMPEALLIKDGQDYYTHHFFPYPNESLVIDVSRPPAKVGESLAFDRAELKVVQGARNSSLRLDLVYRSNRGGEHTIDLPEQYALESVLANGKRLNLQAVDGQLTVPLLPGTNDLIIDMKAEQSFQMLQSQPRFNLNAPVSNLYSQLQLGSQRWVLWTSGPVIGPAVLYWGELLVFILLALIVSRLKFSPLSTVSWILLGLGLSMSNWGVLILVTFWFASVYGASKRTESMNASQYNFSQVLLYALSIVTVLALLMTIPYSLLGKPDMGIDGNAVYGSGLSWFADKSNGELSTIKVLSLPIMAYKGIMLVWVIWLCFAFIKWAKWAWPNMGTLGYWQSDKKNA